MDDDDLLLTTLQETLLFMGYEVVTSSRGEEALQLYESHQRMGKPFDVVILDLSIPNGMGGRETVKLLKDLDPSARVIVSSGFTNDPIMLNFAEYGFSGALAKPYRMQDLADLLQKAFSS